MFYKSINYGGVLQAYALCRVLNNLGYTSEQIKYIWDKGLIPRSKFAKYKKSLRHLLSKALTISMKKCSKMIFSKRHTKELEKLKYRKAAFASFADKYVPVSTEVYDDKTISNANKHYDCFITGSDQVWGTYSIDNGYSLQFADKNKKKVAYAVSGLKTNLEKPEKECFEKIVPEFDAISVREKHMVDLLQSMTSRKIEYVLDPTLLLTKSDWDLVCSDYKIDEEYVFCYFLGESKKQRKLAIEFARKKRLKTVFLPYLKGTYTSADYKTGDYQLYDASPADYISLIKNASYVFTDSFHTCVFSSIYNKEFFVFKRNDCGGLERIKNILSLLKDDSHLIANENKINVYDIINITPIKYENASFIDTLREDSFEFIKNAIK